MPTLTRTLTSLLFVALALPAGACGSLNLEVRAQCHLGSEPRPGAPLTTVRVRTTSAGHAQVSVGEHCTLRATEGSGHGPPWRRSQRYEIDGGECQFEGSPRVQIEGHPMANTSQNTDAPSVDPSFVFVDFNRDTNVSLQGMGPGREGFQLRCEYLAPR